MIAYTKTQIMEIKALHAKYAVILLPVCSLCCRLLPTEDTRTSQQEAPVIIMRWQSVAAILARALISWERWHEARQPTPKGKKGKRAGIYHRVHIYAPCTHPVIRAQMIHCKFVS